MFSNSTFDKQRTSGDARYARLQSTINAASNSVNGVMRNAPRVIAGYNVAMNARDGEARKLHQDMATENSSMRTTNQPWIRMCGPRAPSTSPWRLTIQIFAPPSSTPPPTTRRSPPTTLLLTASCRLWARTAPLSPARNLPLMATAVRWPRTVLPLSANVRSFGFTAVAMSADQASQISSFTAKTSVLASEGGIRDDHQSCCFPVVS